MRKVLFFIIIFIFCINVVEAVDIQVVERYEEEYVDLFPGEFMFKDHRFSNLDCRSVGALDMYQTSSGCIMINNGLGSDKFPGIEERRETNILHSEYDPQTHQLIREVREYTTIRYYLLVESERTTHVDGKTSLEELALVMNRYSETGNKVYEEMSNELGGRVAFSTAVDRNTLLVVAGEESNPSIYNFTYKSDENTLNFEYAANSEDPKVKVLSIIVSNMIDFLLEAQKNGYKALDIVNNPDKIQYVDEGVADDGVSNISITTSSELNQTDMNFKILMGDDLATKIVESYDLNVPRAPETPSEPEPAEPTPDPTQPTQPTQPVPQPNTGDYLPLVGILWLLMFGMVFISCRKTMFKKI